IGDVMHNLTHRPPVRTVRRIELGVRETVCGRGQLGGERGDRADEGPALRVRHPSRTLEFANWKSKIHDRNLAPDVEGCGCHGGSPCEVDRPAVLWKRTNRD